MADDPLLVAAVGVLRDAGEPLHWTVILDRALRSGAIDPFATPNVRRVLLASLRAGVDAGTLRTPSRGVYAIADGAAT